MPITSDCPVIVSECGTEGQWLMTVFPGEADEKKSRPFFQGEADRKNWLPFCCLPEKYANVADSGTWHVWTRDPCPDLDPSINGGALRSMLVPKPAGFTGRPLWRVGLQDDMDLIVSRRSEPDLPARRIDPAGRGKWITQDTFQLTRDVESQNLRAGDLLFTDRKAAAEIGMVEWSDTPGYWRAHPHPALSLDVNGGRLRALKVTKRVLTERGIQKVWVSSQKDWEAIGDWRRSMSEAAGSHGTSVTTADLARDLGLPLDRVRDEIRFRRVLRQFREELPSAARSFPIRDDRRNRVVDEWRYDRAAFLQWLGGRDVSDLGVTLCREATPQTRQRREDRLRRAVAFLQFVLTRGEYEPKTFRRFLAEPPYEVELTPVEAGVRLDAIREWAKRAGISHKTNARGSDKPKRSRRKTCPALVAAARHLGVKWVKAGFAGPIRWRLSTPVMIPAPAQDAAPQPAADPQDLAHNYQVLNQVLFRVDDAIKRLRGAVELMLERPPVPGEDEVRGLPGLGEPPAGPPRREPMSANDITDWPDLMSTNDIADRLGKPRDATRKRLERMAKECPDCVVEVDAPRKGEPKFLYRVKDVLPRLG